MNKISNSKLAYVVVRIAMGLSLVMHGGVRIPKWEAFSTATAESFADTFLPYVVVYSFASVIIVGEVLSGVLLLVGGRWVRWGCALGILLMGFLMFGSGMLEQWQGVMNQIVHVLILYLLLMNPHTPEGNLSKSAK